MKQKVTINDIAELCSVSKSSVSRYLNNGYVSKENAEKIAKVIKETGFETNFFAKRLKAKRSHLIGILISQMNAYDTKEILEGIQLQLHEEGYQGIILIGGNDVKQEIACINNFYQQGVDGILILHTEHVEELQAEIERLEVPILFQACACSYAPCISMDEQQAGFVLGNYLAPKNYTKLVYLEHDDMRSTLRMQGIHEAFASMNIDCTIEQVHYDGSYQMAYELGAKIVGIKPDVVIVDKDEIACCLIKYFHEFHIHVPQQIALVGFDGNPLLEMMSPALTSVQMDYRSFGKKMVTTMVAQLNERGEDKEITIAIEILQRDSTK